MRITLVSPFDPRPATPAHKDGHVGGVERVYAQVSRHLAERGHEVTLICSTEGEPGRDELDGIVRLRETRRFTLFRAPWARLARHIDPDTNLVQVPATYPFTTSQVLRRSTGLGLPCVLDFHFEPEPGTAMGRLAAAAYVHWGHGAYALADAVLVRSRAYGRSSLSLRHVPEERWRVVPNGVDTDRFAPGPDNAQGEYLLFVGRLVPYKGLPVLLRAVARMRSPRPLVVAGDGPLAGRLEAMADRLGIDARFLGRATDEELPGLYRRARVTVLPSVTRQEAFGMTLLESMACGTPVVASALPGVEEIAGIGGWSVPPGDAAALAERLDRAVVSDDLPRGPALANSVRSTYSWDAVTDRLEQVYGDVTAPVPATAARPVPEVMPRRASSP